MSYYGFMKLCLGWVVRTIHRVKAEGMENIEKGQTYLVCSNHISFSDPIVIASVLPCEPHFMAKKELTSIPLVGGFLKSLGAYGIDRKSFDVSAIRKTVDFLKSGHTVVMFPQGTRRAGMLPSETEPKNGCAMIAERAGVPVLPVHIETKGYRQGFLRKTHVTVGKPIYTDEMKSAGGYKEGAALVFGAITEKEGRYQ